jgi:hypothetical protein
MIRRENDMPYANRQLSELVWLKSNGNVKNFAAAIGMSQQRVNRLLVFDKKQDRFPAVSDEVRNACIETFDLEPNYFTLPPTEEEIRPLEMLSEEFNKTPSHPDIIGGLGHKSVPDVQDMFDALIAAKDEIIASKQETIDALKQLLEEKNIEIAALRKQIEDGEKRRVSYMAAEPDNR